MAERETRVYVEDVVKLAKMISAGEITNDQAEQLLYDLSFDVPTKGSP